ncbi:MAG: CopD family protein [Chloroflexi bacterium]|nr:CopD family protein [Chloroflexota bacterium]
MSLQAFLLLLILLSAAPAAAHGYIVRAIPDDRAVLERAPTRLQYWFSESLEPDFSSMTVRDQAGNTVATGGVSGDNAALLSARLPSNLPDGAYVAELRVAFASDGHVITETRLFFVGAEVGGVESAPAAQAANALEVVWRALLLSAALLLLGTFSLYVLVLLPAWGNPAHAAGLLPPRVMRRLSAIIAAALVVAFAGSVIAIIQQAMVLFNAGPGQVIAQNLWSIVRAGTRFGDLWTARVLLLALVAALYGASLYFRQEQPGLVHPFWTASAWAMALVIGTFSAGSHAAGSPLLPWVGIVVDWAHALAVGLWAGGLAALVLVLPVALQPYSGDTRRTALLAALTRFSRLAAVCVVIVVTTGIYSSLNWIYTPSDITQTPFGGALAFKLLLVAGLLLLALAHHAALRPERFARWQAVVGRVQTFLPTLRLEAVLALLVVGAAGLLSATPVPVPPFAQDALPPPTGTQTVGDTHVTLTMTPGGPGVNTYDVTVTRGGQPVENAAVRLRLANPARDWRGAWETAESAGGGLYVAANADIDRAGDWWALVNVDNTRAAFAWTISDDAAVPQWRNPGLLNLLALAGVIVALAWAVYPLARRVYRRLDLNPANVTIAIGAVVATTLFIVIGVVVIQTTQAQYDATLNPLPAVVNPVLPDTASLERGQALFKASCGWQGSDWMALVERLPRTRDEALYAAVRDGWRTLPPCAGLDDRQRWDVMNYVRSYEERGMRDE